MVLGIVAEYNPFHNGHLYHILKSKEKAKDLVEAYDILDDKNMPKEDKINLLKDYINKDNNK